MAVFCDDPVVETAISNPHYLYHIIINKMDPADISELSQDISELPHDVFRIIASQLPDATRRLLNIEQRDAASNTTVATNIFKRINENNRKNEQRYQQLYVDAIEDLLFKEQETQALHLVGLYFQGKALSYKPQIYYMDMTIHNFESNLIRLALYFRSIVLLKLVLEKSPDQIASFQPQDNDNTFYTMLTLWKIPEIQAPIEHNVDPPKMHRTEDVIFTNIPTIVEFLIAKGTPPEVITRTFLNYYFQSDYMLWETDDISILQNNYAIAIRILHSLKPILERLPQETSMKAQLASAGP